MQRLRHADAERPLPADEKLLFAGLRVRMTITTGKAERKLVSYNFSDWNRKQAAAEQAYAFGQFVGDTSLSCGL